MKAIIFCDDLAFAVSAASTLARVGRQAGVNVKWRTKYWLINASKNFAFAEKALVRSLDSHIIVFPAERASTLPSWVFDWLSRWAARRTVQNAGLGVIKERNAPGPNDPRFPELSTFAHQHGLSLIMDERLPAQSRLSVSFRGVWPIRSEFSLFPMRANTRNKTR